MSLDAPRGVVIFDFDGVLADSFDLLARLNAEVLGRAGLALDREGYRRLFLGNVHDGIRRLIPGERERRKVLREKASEMARRYPRVALFPFASALVKRLRGRCGLAIVSSNDRLQLERVLRRCRLRESFGAVFGSRALSKRTEILAAVRALGGRKTTSLFVTDTVGDVRVGRSAGLRTVGVSWGFHPAAWLRRAGAERVFAKPEALSRYLLGAAG